MSRTNKTRTGSWKGHGGHTYVKNSGKTYWKRNGNKWGRQTVKQRLKAERQGQSQKFAELVRMDFMHDRGLVQHVMGYFGRNEPDLPMEPYEMHDRWSYT